MSFSTVFEYTNWVKKQSKAQHTPNYWKTLQQNALNCKKCELCQTRTHVVFGTGNEQADLMIIGEAPGFHEDQKGEPFVGRAGQLLNNMLAAIELDRKTIYIANVVKCRPPQNRDPLKEEVATCTPYLLEQMAYIQPKLLVAVGRIAAQFLLDSKKTLASLRQTIHTYGDNHIPLIVTYHPAYLLRNPADKKKAYLDLLFIKQQLEKRSTIYDGISTTSREVLQ